MELRYNMADDSYLMHYGVMGMKWGVRNAETLRKYEGGGKKPSKRQVKKAIRQSKRQYRKETGEWRTTGKNQAAVDKAFRTEYDADQKINEYISTMKKSSSKIEKEKEKLNTTKLRKDHLTRLQQDPEASSSMRRAAEQEYLKARKKSSNSRNVIEKASKNYYSALDGHNVRAMEIAKSYKTKWEDATVKDLGFKNVETGKKLLNEYGLMNKAIGYRKSYSDSKRWRSRVPNLYE